LNKGGPKRKFNSKTKYCPVCKNWLLHIYFSKSKANPPSYLAQQCKLCFNAVKYKLTRERYDALMSGTCAFPDCNNKVDHIDHDHSCCKTEHCCGKCVRGGLCRMHNTGLGHFKDNINELRKAILYLEQHKKFVPNTSTDS
jgi:hypothetical protein